MAEEREDGRPKALRYAAAVNAVEQMIIDALPDIVSKLTSMAKDGDLRAARYLVDRILGRVAFLPAAPAVDKSLPYSRQEWGRAKFFEEQKQEAFRREVLTPLRGMVDGMGVPGIGRVDGSDRDGRRRGT